MLRLSETGRETGKGRGRERTVCIKRRKKGMLPKGGRIPSEFWGTVRCVTARKDEESDLGKKEMYKKIRTKFWNIDDKMIGRIRITAYIRGGCEKCVCIDRQHCLDSSLQWFSSWTEEMKRRKAIQNSS